jgi:aspartyl-tRNA(Asn)/glutamyl-tRNA(Gln) amidotransferase subunit A
LIAVRGNFTVPDVQNLFPRLFVEPEQTIAGASRALREGRTTCTALVAECLAQIDHWEPEVRAWVVVDRDRAAETARRLDRELSEGKDRGPLHGIPIGIKDLIDVAGLPTACGAQRWARRRARSDATVVANLREAGAVILGKTITTPYACIDPSVTRNPWNLDRTPGGSSSGSAAAVACGMCFAALGTQTGGSITRPAAFCGIAGMKPSYAQMSMHGIFPLAPSLDHVGPLARTVADLELLYHAMRGALWNQELSRAVPSPSSGPPRLGRLRGFFDRHALPDMKLAIDAAATALGARGADIVELDDPVDFKSILQDHRRVVAPEAAAIHTEWLDSVPDDYPPQIRLLIEAGRSMTALEYLKARDRMDQARGALHSALARESLGALILPAALGSAPSPATTGDAAFNTPWSFTHLPSVSFPVGLADDGLPLAIQLVGDLAGDLDLLQTAARCELALQTA